MKSRKVVVCIDDMKNFLETYEKKESFIDELKAQDVTFLHVFEKTFYNDEFSQYSWPSEDLYSEINEKVNERLKKIADGFSNVVNSSKTACIIEDDARQAVTQYLKVNKADKVIVFARGLSQLEELFLSSMTEHLVRTAPCPILVMREK